MNTGKNPDYRSFLDSKTQLDGDYGFPPTFLPEYLFPFQSALVDWAVRKGRAALFSDCGTGKSIMQLIWAQNVVEHTGKSVLILTPLAVAQQIVREAATFGIDASRSVRGERGSPIVVTNYERLHLFKPKDFAGVVCDECFPAGTEIDTPTGKKHIENVIIGDRIINASGVDVVSDVHRREVPHAVRITVNGSTIVSSPNHPYFTRSGWKGAMDLIAGDEIMATSAAMRMVRRDVHGEMGVSGKNAVLRSILLSEMADATTGASCQGAYAGVGGEAWPEKAGVACLGQTGGEGGNRAHTLLESHAESGNTREGLPHIESDEPRTFRAWGKWTRNDETAVDADGCVGRVVGGGVCLVLGQTDSRLSRTLQDRLSVSRSETRDRGGWELPSQPEGTGSEEGRTAGFARVDRLEVLEPGHPDMDRFRDADGKFYFYDLGATRHPSFSVNGLLVHNSSILKSYDGSSKAEITEFMRQLPYRLLATATAAPNDYTELGTSSEALGYLGYMDMLGRFFVNDQNTSKAFKGRWRTDGDWRFKGHAETAFWKWVASWARALRKPSDLGFSDDGFDLPTLTQQKHVVSARSARPGLLFDIGVKGFQEEREERKRTITERCETVASLVADTGKQAVVWCQLNDEGDTLARMIPDAQQVSGKDSEDSKEEKFVAFSTGQLRVLVTKPIIGAWGMNWQNCDHLTYFPSHSYEQYYQAVRRCWRFGQQSPVTVDIVATEAEVEVQENLQRKSNQADRMFSELVSYMQQGMAIERSAPLAQTIGVPSWLTR